MMRDETKKIVMIIASTYPNWHPADMSFTVDAWASMLESFSYQQISAALKAFILSDTSGFAPSVGQLIGLLDKVGNGQELSEMEAWSLLRNWAQTDMQSVENVIQSNFMRTYRQELAKSREMRKIPQNIRALLERPEGVLIEDK